MPKNNRSPFQRNENTKVDAHPSYWKVKAAFLEVQQITANAKAAVAQAEAKFVATLTGAGLDPASVYTLSDETESITIKT